MVTTNNSTETRSLKPRRSPQDGFVTGGLGADPRRTDQQAERDRSAHGERQVGDVVGSGAAAFGERPPRCPGGGGEEAQACPHDAAGEAAPPCALGGPRRRLERAKPAAEATRSERVA
jgi:hypothetical protein